MINIVCFKTQFDDKRQITVLKIKVKYVEKDGEVKLHKHAFIASVSAAFYNTTLLTDEGSSLETIPDPERQDIVDLKVNFKVDSSMSINDVAIFVAELQEELDKTSLFEHAI